MSEKKHRSFNVLGNIAIVNFSEKTLKSEKIKFAKEILKKNNSIKTVLEKSGNFKGRLRKMTTSWLAGEKTKEVLYKENDCVFRFNVDETYFSPRLSNERKEISSLIKDGEEVLVMFAGVAPFPIVIARKTHAKKVYSNELNKKANKYAELNIEKNAVKTKVILLPGDIKKVAEKIKKGWYLDKFSFHNPSKTIPQPPAHKKLFNKSNYKLNEIVSKKFDVIVMPRPQLKDSFLKQAFDLSKKGTRIYYYDFCRNDEINLIAEKIQNEAKHSKKKIKILKMKSAGELAPYKIRCRIDFKVLN
ncbi:MAG: hypothetical protein WC812_00825 [Candidatus Pacearchaeota archaeon]